MGHRLHHICGVVDPGPVAFPITAVAAKSGGVLQNGHNLWISRKNREGQDFLYTTARRIDLTSTHAPLGRDFEMLMRFMIVATSWFAVAGLAALLVT